MDLVNYLTKNFNPIMIIVDNILSISSHLGTRFYDIIHVNDGDIICHTKRIDLKRYPIFFLETLLVAPLHFKQVHNLYTNLIFFVEANLTIYLCTPIFASSEG